MMSSPWEKYYSSLKIPYEEIQSATNNFADENLITQEEDSSVEVYKGQLLLSGQLIHIVVHKSEQYNNLATELMMSYVLHQQNLTSVVARAKKEECFILVRKHEANGSLDKHLSGSALTWLQRLHICLGVANALTCLYYSNLFRNSYCMIHGDIKSSKILLDHNWEPKLQGSKFSLLTKRNHLQPTSKHTTTLQYLDPTYETTGGLTHKSDVFSFGVVLFEVLFGRKAFVLNEDNWYFARLARLHYEETRLDEMIDPDLRKQMNLQSLKIFSETAYFCLKEERQQRPEMNQIFRRLERALELQKRYESPDQSTVADEGTSIRRSKSKNLDHLRIPLSDIISATKNFSETYYIGKGGYGTVYKAKLNLHGRNSLETETNNKDELSTVALKRIFTREDKHGEEGFLAEIEMLSNCKHSNIISLLGFCDEGPEMILIYDYASKHSLDDYFENDDNIVNLTWAQRIQICLDIAHGLQYLHTHTQGKEKIIHRDIKSANILLDDNWVAKIADFGLSKLHEVNEQGSTLITSTIAGTEVYLDPEYKRSGKLKKASDIYSFGVVMFEIFCGRLAYDNVYNEKPLPSIIRECFNKGTLREIVDPKIKEIENNFLLNRGFHEDSVDTFLKIAYQCLEDTQAKRPKIEVIIEELKKAFDLQSQSNLKDNLQISLKDIKLATGNFNDDNCVGEGRFWKLYEGEFGHTDANIIVAKRWDNKSSQGHNQFLRELEILLTRKHENIIGLVGYCSENDEKIIVYEHLSNGRLDKHLADPSLTWMRRLQICIDIASALDFLHGGGERDELKRIHRDIKTASILLDGDWKAKLSNLELSSKPLAYEEIQHFTDNAYGSLDYVDPRYKLGFLRKQSDIYSLGVVLMEILCGRLARTYGCEDPSQSVGTVAKNHFQNEGTLDELVFWGIKDQIASESLITFQGIALRCLEERWSKRPDASVVLEELKKALEFQEDLEIWERKLPTDYKQIIQMSTSPDIYSNKTKKDIYSMLTKGILLQKGKVWFSLGANGEKYEMISTKLSCENRRSLNWLSIPTSRFQKVALMSDMSKLKTQIKIKTRFLSPGVIYGVYLVFKFLNVRKVSSAPMYVNLTYKMENETLHTYFTTWRDDEWMMIELGRGFTHSKELDFEVQLDSFSRCYCKSGAIYVEGIEFREINNVEHEQIEKLNALQRELPIDSRETPKRSQSYDTCVKIDSRETPKRSQSYETCVKTDSGKTSKRSESYDKCVKDLQNKLNDKKHHFLSANEALYHSSNVKIYYSNPVVYSRFEVVGEVIAQQVLHIKCKIESQMLLSDTDYTCYLVFKLSEKCRGLHCPVIVRDLLRWNNKETKLLYFRSPSPLNRHNIRWIPETREDGWMEVGVWEGNLKGKFRNDHLPMNLKLITYEGNMSGLIVHGLEFRLM